MEIKKIDELIFSVGLTRPGSALKLKWGWWDNFINVYKEIQNAGRILFPDFFIKFFLFTLEYEDSFTRFNCPHLLYIL
jgi:hypothetical protein